MFKSKVKNTDPLSIFEQVVDLKQKEADDELVRWQTEQKEANMWRYSLVDNMKMWEESNRERLKVLGIETRWVTRKQEVTDEITPSPEFTLILTGKEFDVKYSIMFSYKAVYIYAERKVNYRDEFKTLYDIGMDDRPVSEVNELALEKVFNHMTKFI